MSRVWPEEEITRRAERRGISVYVQLGQHGQSQMDGIIHLLGPDGAEASVPVKYRHNGIRQSVSAPRRVVTAAFHAVLK
jgi:hypothetical protein